jgi:nitrogen fixation-related uncharacterized protein
VVWINFSFDISVKLFSLFLLFITILLLAPSFKKLFQFFILNKPTTLPYLRGQQLIQAKIIRYFAKAIILLFIFIETLLPYIQSGQFNDDKTPRLPLHGAYEITSIASDKTEEDLEDLNLKRFFIHRQAYFIFQYDDDSMEDFKLDIDTVRNMLNLTDYDGNSFALAYKVDKASNSIEIKSIDLGWIINSHPLPWKDLPLLQPLFHWTVDEIQ